MTAKTKFGYCWPSYDHQKIRIDGGQPVEVLHKAADQDGWDGGIICRYNEQLVHIEEDALKYE